MQKKMKSNLFISAIAIVLLGVALFTMISPKNGDNSGKTEAVAVSAINEKGDMIIPISGITEKASFYTYNELDTQMGIIAVKASDGSIRTAFNTCQVCYSSGRGYYKQEGDVLVCQNCGNQFSMDQVQITKGGCNPVPIDEQSKVVSDSTITISKDFLKQMEAIFANWKI